MSFGRLHHFAQRPLRFIVVLNISISLLVSGVLGTSCRKSSTPTAADNNKNVEVSGTVSNEDPTEFTQADESVQIGGVNLVTSPGYTVTVFALDSLGNLTQLYTKKFSSNKLNFKMKAIKSKYLIVKVVRDDGGTFGGILPPLTGTESDGKLIRMIFDRTTSVASKMLEIVATMAKSGDPEARKSLDQKSIAVVDALMVAQPVRRAVDEQLKLNEPAKAIDLVVLAKSLVQKSNERLELLATEGISKTDAAKKLAQKAYDNVYGDFGESTAPGLLAYRTNLDLGSTTSAKKEVAYESIQASKDATLNAVIAAFQTEAEIYRTASSVAEARTSETLVATKYTTLYRACTAGDSTNCFSSAYSPPPPPPTIDSGGTTGPVGPQLPGGPQISVADQAFSIAFSTDISQNATNMPNFKEFRYTLNGAAPTCSTGTASSAQPTTVNIPTATTVLKVVSCDDAGNISAVTTATYTYDTTPPNPPVVSSVSAFSASASVTWTWTSGGGGGSGNYRYRLDNSDLSTGTTSTSAGTVTIGSLSQAAHILYVQERDTFGNWSTSGSFSVTVDTTIPGAPQISVATSSFNAAFSTNVSQNATTDTNFKEFRYTTSGVDPTCSSGTASTAQPTSVSIPASTTTLKVVSCDKAGNISAVTTATYTYDITPPNAPSVTSASAFSSSTSVTWTWTSGGGGGNGNFRYRLNNADLTTGSTTTAAGTVPISALAQGAHILYVQESDAAGNWSASGSYSVTVDTTSPGAPQISVATSSFNAAFSTNVSQNATTDTNFKEFRYTTSGIDPTCSSGTASTAQPTSVSIPASTSTLKAASCDKAGNMSPVTTVTYTFDNTPPNAPSVTSSSSTSSSSTVTWTWTSGGGGGNGSYRYRLDNSDLTTGATTTSTASATINSLSNAAHTLYVQERDAAGNWSTSGSYTVTVSASGLAAASVSAGGTWMHLAWGGGTGPYTAKLYTDNTCATEIRSLSGITSTDVIFGGLTQNANYYHRVFDSASGSTSCTLKYSGFTSSSSLNLSKGTADWQSIPLSFSDPFLTGLSNFLVYKFTGGGCGSTAVQYSSVPAVNDAGTETVSGLDSNTSYSFQVFSSTSFGNFSNCVSGITSVNNADAIYPFDSQIILKVKNSTGPMRVRAWSGVDCNGTTFYDSSATITAGNYANVTGLSADSDYYLSITDNASYTTCHHIQTTSATSSLLLNANPSLTSGEINLDWAPGNGGPYLLLQFSETLGPCEGKASAIFSHNSTTSFIDVVGSGASRDYLVLSGNGGPGYTRTSNCAQAQAN